MTLRHHEPCPFPQFPERAARASLGCSPALTEMLGLLEDIIDRLADITVNVGGGIDAISRGIFLIPVLERRAGGKSARGMVRSFQRDLRTIAEQAGFCSRRRRCCSTRHWA